MSRTFDCREPGERRMGLEQAARAVKRGKLVVLPTDTVYGLGADAFSPDAIGALLAAKGRGRGMPVPVLVGSPSTVDGIATRVPPVGRALMEAFWPGGLTLVCHEQPSLQWDLGDSDGTVAIRMPLHPVAIELLRETGPMGVSSANRSGHQPAQTAAEAVDQLGDSVAVYLEAGPTEDIQPSTIVDVTGAVPRVLRVGAIPVDVLREVASGIEVGG